MASKPPVKNVHVTKHDLISSLRRWGGSAGATVLEDAEATQLTFELAKSLAELKTSGSAAAISNIASKLAEDSKTSKGFSSGLKSTAFVLNELDITLSAKMILDLRSPGSAGAAVGFMLLQKTGVAVSLLPKNQKTAQCVSALMSLAGNAGVTALTGLGTGPIAILTISALLASSANAVNTCVSP